MTGLPRRWGSSRCATEAKNASRSAWRIVDALMRTHVRLPGRGVQLCWASRLRAMAATRSDSRAWWTLAAVCVPLFAVALNTTSSSAALPAMVIAGRALQGLGAAFIVPLWLSIIGVTFARDRRLGAIGIWAAVVGLGFALGPVIGGLLTDALGWQSVFWFNLPLGVTALL